MITKHNKIGNLTFNPLIWIVCLCFLAGLNCYAQKFIRDEKFQEMTPMDYVNGVSVADYDLDGDLDIYAVAIDAYDESKENSINRLLRNDGNGFFTDVTFESGLEVQYNISKESLMGVKMGASWGDYDNDGYPDLYLTNNGKNQLWHNEGDGTFFDQSSASGLVGCDCYSSSAVWWDYDNDSHLDLYVSNWTEPNVMYRNNGDATFTDVSEESGLKDTGATWTSLPIDVNRDGHLDLYLVNDYMENRFYLNLGNGKFIEKAAEYGLVDDGDGMGVDICDFNNDGKFDIYVTNIYTFRPNSFFISNLEGTYEDYAEELGVEDTGWGWGARFFDVDNDMDDDLYVVNGSYLQQEDENKFFLNINGKFEEISKEIGLNFDVEGRGLEVFDYDQDGDIDMLLGNWGSGLSVYKNLLMEEVGQSTKNWLKVTLEGTQSNRSGLGSIISIKAGEMMSHKLHFGTNLLGQSLKPIHFGLADHVVIDELIIHWPSGLSEILRNVNSNQHLRLQEGSMEAYSTVNTITKIVDDRLNTDIALKIVSYVNPIIIDNPIQIEVLRPGILKWSISDVNGRCIYREDHYLGESGKAFLEYPEVFLNESAGVFTVNIIFEDENISLLLLK